MNMNLVPKIMGWLVVIITLALAPTINTYNGYVTDNVTAATNASSMIGMTAVDDFAAPLMIISLLFTGSMIGLGKIGDGSVKAILGTIGAVVITIVALAMFGGSIIGYVDTLITASSGFAQTIYGVIPIIIYVAIIAGAGVVTAATYVRGRRKKSRSTRAFM